MSQSRWFTGATSAFPSTVIHTGGVCGEGTRVCPWGSWTLNQSLRRKVAGTSQATLQLVGQPQKPSMPPPGCQWVG